MYISHPTRQLPVYIIRLNQGAEWGRTIFVLDIFLNNPL